MRACPFCGSDRLENLDAAAHGGAVMCIDCGAHGLCRFAALELKTRTAGGEGIADGLEAWEVRTPS